MLRIKFLLVIFGQQKLIINSIDTFSRKKNKFKKQGQDLEALNYGQMINFTKITKFDKIKAKIISFKKGINLKKQAFIY